MSHVLSATHARPLVILLGASNVTRSRSIVIESARVALGAHAMDVLAAIGHGRSYGITSSFCGRALPGILQCELWSALQDRERSGNDAVSVADRPAVYALITDIGNDIMYGQTPQTIIEWVGECVRRLVCVHAQVIVTGVPFRRIERVTPGQFRMVQRIMFSGSTLSYDAVHDRVRTLHDGIAQLARGTQGVTYVEPDPGWYGIDPIHLHREAWPVAWRAMLAPWRKGNSGNGEVTTAMARPSLDGWTRLRLSRPAGWKQFGRVRSCIQPDCRLRGGTLVYQY
ncbi:MAG: hypothetical protein ACR2GY_12235 [Phycisphaerales bacterium]